MLQINFIKIKGSQIGTINSLLLAGATNILYIINFLYMTEVFFLKY